MTRFDVGDVERLQERPEYAVWFESGRPSKDSPKLAEIRPEVRQDEDGPPWTVRVVGRWDRAMKSAIGAGDTYEEAFANALDELNDWLAGL